MTENTNKLKQRIKKLNDDILNWDHHYFNLDESLVSDEQYDASLWELQSYKITHPELFNDLEKNSLDRVGANLLQNTFEKVLHKRPMISLNKAHSAEDIIAFLTKLKTVGNNLNINIQPKIDGLSIALHYENGYLKQALTRGDGVQGEDVTANVRMIENVPKNIAFKGILEVRGEVYLPISAFNHLVEEEGLELANPRNAASGALRQKNSMITKERKLATFLYELVDPENYDVRTYQGAITFLKEQGFSVPNSVNFNLKEESKIIDYLKSFDRDQVGDFQIDGLVLKLNEFQYYEKLGSTAKFIHAAIAFKFSATRVITKLIDIFPTVGRTGVITYNAKLNPVELNGTIVSAATLHNHDYIKSLNINLNDDVVVIKAGEIIPKVISLANEKDEINFYPAATNCPSCSTDLMTYENLIDQYCINENCPEINIKKLIYFVSKGAMNINGFGDKKIEFLYNQNLLNDIPSLYKLKDHRDEILALDGFAKKSVDDLLKQIEISKNIGIEKILVAVGIKHIGNTVAKQLVDELIKYEVTNFDELINFNFDVFNDVNNFGPITSQALNDYFKQQKNIDLFMFFREQNFVFIKANDRKLTSDKLANLSFVITGTLSKSRDFYKELIETNGGKFVSSISKNTSYLLAGDDAGSKLEKAAKLGIKIIDENQLNDLLN